MVNISPNLNLNKSVYTWLLFFLIPITTICQSETDFNKIITERLVNEWFNKHDTALFEQFIHSDYQGFGGRETRSDYKQQIIATFKAFPDLNMKIHDMIAEANKIVIRFTFSGTHTGIFAGISPTNKTISWTGIGILTFKEGKLIERWNESDVLKLMTQIGAVKPVHE